MTTPITDEKTEQLTPPTPAAPARAEAAQSVLAQAAPTKPKRTLGLRLVDLFIYPIINNIGVFVLSVGLTYMSKHGADKGKTGELVFGKIGEAIHTRTQFVRKFFKHIGCGDKSADNYTTVAFSFLDGTIFALPIKLLEDRREKIAHWIDDRFGKSKDESAYIVEPKQSWGSVITGRLATASIVVPTALLLDHKGWNDKMFTGWGNKLSSAIESRPTISSLFSKKLSLPKISNIMVFEAFYTSVCTAGIYFISRAFAKKHPVGEKRPIAHSTVTNVPTIASASDDTGVTPPKITPHPTVTSPTHLSRLAAPSQTAELTA